MVNIPFKYIVFSKLQTFIQYKNSEYNFQLNYFNL